MKYTLTFLWIIFIVSVVTLNASEEIGRQVRLEVVPQWYSKDKIKVYGQISIRKEFNKNEWKRYVVKPSIAYSLGDFWSLRGGLGLLYTDNRGTKDNSGLVIADRFEIRPFQGLKYNYVLNEKWNIDTYGRLEERFDFNVDTKNSINSLRLRLRLRAIYRFSAYQSGKYYRAMFSWEGFSSLSGSTHQTDEKYRVTLGLERSFNHNQKGRVEVTWESQDYLYSRDASQIEYSQIYLRVRYYPTWGTLLNKIRRHD
ncbi:MAG: hypothetical protein DRG24_03520 [Epsilonproteobacteria bacterium]|nr:MAG: hypothetical protein DRG24_03520 [Campylobacterota bacterium]